MKDFSKIYQLKGLKPKNKGRTNFYECCDLTEKVYLMYVYVLVAGGVLEMLENFWKQKRRQGDQKWLFASKESSKSYIVY